MEITNTFGFRLSGFSEDVDGNEGEFSFGIVMQEFGRTVAWSCAAAVAVRTEKQEVHR